MKLLPESIRACYPSFKDRQEQKQMMNSLGEQLYKVVYAHNPRKLTNTIISIDPYIENVTDKSN